MTKEHKEMAVAALRNGTVIDHIPSQALFRAVHILGIEKLDTSVTIGNNLQMSLIHI
ncbi:MAG: aspartate carbamoyltransferase regulatory subunit, partial [Muribaculaceae bacterium]|nr:aspartate carbamoyltransferase regulatory subunit [Muribaculaceae bacterium]